MSSSDSDDLFTYKKKVSTNVAAFLNENVRDSDLGNIDLESKLPSMKKRKRGRQQTTPVSTSKAKKISRTDFITTTTTDSKRSEAILLDSEFPLSDDDELLSPTEINVADLISNPGFHQTMQVIRQTQLTLRERKIAQQQKDDDSNDHNSNNTSSTTKKTTPTAAIAVVEDDDDIIITPTRTTPSANRTPVLASTSTVSTSSGSRIYDGSEGAVAVSAKIVLRVRCGPAEADILKFRISTNDPLEKLLRAVCAKRALSDASKVKLIFDGEALDMRSTPEDHDMEADDLLDLRTIG